MSRTTPHPFSFSSTRPPAGGATSRAAAHVRRSFELLSHLLRGELDVLPDLARTAADTRAALLLVPLAALAAGLGAWFWLALAVDGAQIGAAAIRLVVLGSVAAVVAWALSVAVSWWALYRICELRVDILRLARPLALAGVVGVAQLALLIVPISFAVGLVTVIAWFLISILAVRAASPGIDDRSALIAVGLGVAAWALFLSILASTTGVAPGIFIHAAPLDVFQ